jgi:HlyD family secretion protein
MHRSISESKLLVHTPALDKPNQAPKLRLLFVCVSLLVTSVGLGIWYWRPLQSQFGLVKLSGRIEGYETDVGAKIGGRVNIVTVREGERVRKGQLIVQLDDAEVQAQLRGTVAHIGVTQQGVNKSLRQIKIIDSQILEARLNLQQATSDAEGRIFQAEANVAGAESGLVQAKAQLSQAESELNLAKDERDRYTKLFKQGATTQQQLIKTQTSMTTAEGVRQARAASVSIAQKQVNAAIGNMLQVKTTKLNSGIRNAQLESILQQRDQANFELKAAQREVDSAKADLQQIQAQVAYLKIKSPIDGIVTNRTVEPGAVVTTGKTLLVLLNPDTVYFRGFIPNGEIGKIRVGQKAKVFLDSAPNKSLSAMVAAIDAKASFTPENIYFHQDRVKQVFGVKLSIDRPEGFAKAGMPADAEILPN